MLIMVTHAGTGSDQATEHDGPRRASERGLQLLADGLDPLDAAVAACAQLEDDPRFNAGTGSNLRFDGKTIEMDAACMATPRRFGAVCSVQRVRNPVAVARALVDTPHVMLTGEGAQRFARALGMPDHDPWSPKAQSKFETLRAQLRAAKLDPADSAWNLADLQRLWNYPRPIRELLEGSDTVGAVATDGERFAAALSTGGTMATLLGRVGDVPLPGCGLQAGPAGAVACTGNGDEIARWQVAGRAYRWIEDGMDAQAAVEKAIALFTLDVDVGVIAVARDGAGAASNRSMAWAKAEGKR
jgi:isoaspartyl peptidase/L-asparaginase-like protein (Ntn-hydrolase superfamily)